MRLKALRLHGFKSFADRTEIAFHDGITAVVGPNGCGKSNISDAIRWVLGEQRPTAIRGARMEEAIFQGTVNRRPVHRGSVAMELSNPAGALPVPFEEVEISRTVYRDGGSDYQLNRSSCRLKDIHDLCRDTGLGANAYAVIENRMIDAILSDRAEERRGLFEEAAGIGKYKDRRKSATRRLEQAEGDLQRLEDVIAEVESKVRSLARQKGRAERFHELRSRRLGVDVTLARLRLEGLEERLAELQGLLAGGTEETETLQVEIATAETRLETLRAEQIDAEKARSLAGRRVEEVRSELVRWERELAVAAEKAGSAERRLARIEEERAAARTRIDESTARSGELRLEHQERSAELEMLRSRVRAERSAADEVRKRFASARDELEGVEGLEREVARRMAQLRGDAESAEAQVRELELREEHLRAEVRDATDALAELRAQGDLFADRLDALEGDVTAAAAAVSAAEEGLERAQETLERRRTVEVEAQDRAVALETRRTALERMDRDREGMDPVLKALLGNPPDGLVGILADFLSADPEVMSAVESYLGVTSRAVVVRDGAAAARLATWFHEEWSGGGGLVLLPLDRVPEPAGDGSLLERVEPRGEGAPWVRALLSGVDLREGGLDPAPGAPLRDRVAPDGTSETRGGIVRIGNPLGATGLLERREELRRLRTEADQARIRADGTREEREGARDRLREAELALRAARTALVERERAYREARARDTERLQQGTRLERALEELHRQQEAAEAGRLRAIERIEAATREGEGFAGEEEKLRDQRLKARAELEAVQEEWEAVRGRVSELTVEEARLEGQVLRLTEQLAELERNRKGAERRLESLDREEAELRAEVSQTTRIREEGAAATTRLLDAQAEATALLRERDRVMETLHESVAEAEKRLRRARAAERDASEGRHRHELEASELHGRVARIRDRIEGEWGRSLEELLETVDSVEGEEEELGEELAELARKLERLGPVNMLAVEEHEEESARLSFLREQHEDLIEARDDLRSAIREINQTATRLFMETFEGVRENFRDTFVRLFQGGEADLWLEDPDDPLESVIEIHASPRGKRTQRIDLLSGGERALTALSLLFGIYLVKPSPFCVLDEVDAPLDESNIGRFIRLLQEFKAQTQFIVITHNPRTIEAADWIYGVTMEEPGVSSIVGVRLEEALEAAAG